jgi:aarF domain-containing kinase
MFARGMQIATDVVGLVDEWAARFFEELDYVTEGENGTRFAEHMRVDLPQVRNCSHLWALFDSVGGSVCVRHLFSQFHSYIQSHSVVLGQVVVPKTFTKYTSRRVLTTSWIEGEKLSQSTANDVGDLVNIGVICYLKQVGTYLSPLFSLTKLPDLLHISESFSYLVIVMMSTVLTCL